ncbi:TetR/AcrR family transcriptional regulator [Bacillus carboniphilus]|uniref:TetR/AcrR family transcriptional regulator n=1 Tax=Bacillus carboniphilus TaxID=86663 RepID=A0ABN0WNF3_9BACI
MDGFQRRREQKKLDILDASLNLFLKYGIQKVSISEIAKEANVSQVTIYNYFENKHKLIQEAFIYYVDKTMNEFEKVLNAEIPYPEKIKSIIFNKKEAATEINKEFYEYMMKQYSTEGNYIEQVYAQKALPAFIQLFEEGKQQGYVDPNLSNEAILFYVQMLKEYFQQEHVYQKAFPLTEEIASIFFYGVLGKRDH